MSGMLESLTNPANKDQLEERMARVKEDPSLKPILDEIENGGPAAMMRSCTFTSFIVDSLVDFGTSFMKQSYICMVDDLMEALFLYYIARAFLNVNLLSYMFACGF